MHTWGDGFNFMELDSVMDWMSSFYKKCTGEHLMVKEKYGTIRYESEWMWKATEENERIFNEMIERAVKKWPHLEAEIRDDVF